MALSHCPIQHSLVLGFWYFFDRVEAGLVGHKGGNKANQLLPVT